MATLLHATVAMCALVTGVAMDQTPSDSDAIRQMVQGSPFCGILHNKFMEGIMTRQVCSKAQKTLNITIPHCQASAEQVWDMAAKMCDKGSDIEKWFCGIAHDKTKEDEIVGKMCAEVEDWQMKTFNVSMPDAVCHQVVETAWEPFAQMCPKKDLLQASQSNIDSTLCGMLDSKFMEGMMTREVCSKVGKALNITIPHCQASAEQVWDMAAKMCHKGTDIEKLFCGIAHDKTKESEIVGKMCAQVEDWQMKTFNVSLPDAVCHQLVENAIEPLAQMCPKDRKTALKALPTEIIV